MPPCGFISAVSNYNFCISSFMISRTSSAAFGAAPNIEHGLSNVILLPSICVITPPASSIIIEAAAPHCKAPVKHLLHHTE